jgi:phytoene synthase
VLAGGREPLISRIKLAWWRDSLEALDAGSIPGEPVLQAVAAEVLPNGVAGTELAAMEEGWAILLGEEPLGEAELSAYAKARGGLLFRYSARLLGGPADERIDLAGQAWALADLSRHIGSKSEREAALAACRERAPNGRWPKSLRPVSMLAALARRDCEGDGSEPEAQGSPGRMLRMLRLRLTGF